MEENKSKRGRKPIVPATPEELWEAFIRYRSKCEATVTVNERTGVVFHTPLTWVGFMDDMGSQYRPRRFKEYYSAKGENWAVTIARIENAIERDQLEGALMGSYSPNLVARINGYTEKTENKHEVKGGFIWKEIE